MKTTSSLKKLPTTKSIKQEKQKLLVIILCENQNVQFEQFSLDIYDQSFYTPDDSLAKIQIVYSFKEFQKIQKQPNKEYFILSSDKAIDEIYNLINVRQKWVIYDSSKKGSVKRINDLPNVVYKTRQIQSLREKLESRKFISKQRLINEKYRLVYEKQLKKASLQQKEVDKPIKQMQQNSIQKVIESQSKQKGSINKNVNKGQNMIKDEKKIKIIKQKSTTLSCKDLNIKKQVQNPHSYSYYLKTQLNQVKEQTQKLRKTKSNENFCPFQPNNHYESQSNMQFMSKNSISLQNNNLKKQKNLYQNYIRNKTKQQKLSEQKDTKTQQQLSCQTKYDDLLLINSGLLTNNYDVLPTSSVQKTQQFPNNQTTFTNQSENNKQNQNQSNTLFFTQNHNQSQISNNNSAHSVQNIDDYEFQKIAPIQSQSKTKHKNSKIKKQIKFVEPNYQINPKIPLKKQKSLSLNYFSNRNKLSDILDKNKERKINIPKNPFEMRLHHSKSQLKNRSLLSASKSLNSKVLKSARQKFVINKKSSQKLRTPFRRYLSSGNYVEKQRTIRQQMSTIQSEENKMSPVRSDGLDCLNKRGLKKSLFGKDFVRKSDLNNYYELADKEQFNQGKPQQVSVLYLVDQMLGKQFIDKISQLTTCNDSVYRFKTMNQLKNQITQSQTVYQLVFVFNQKTLSDKETKIFQEINPSSYFITVNKNIQTQIVSNNKITVKSLDNFNRIVSTIIANNQKHQLSG